MSPEMLEDIRLDYITTDISIRDLAEKYGMSKSSLDRLIKKQAWNLERKAIETVAVKKAHKKTPVAGGTGGTKELEVGDKIGGTTVGQLIDHYARRKELLYATTDDLLTLVREMLKTSTAMAPRDLQAMSSTLMNIKQLHDIKPETVDEDSSGTVEIRLTGELEDWAG